MIPEVRDVCWHPWPSETDLRARSRQPRSIAGPFRQEVVAYQGDEALQGRRLGSRVMGCIQPFDQQRQKPAEEANRGQACRR